MTVAPIPPITDELTLELRAYAAADAPERTSPGKRKAKLLKPALPASAWSIIFDTETTVDAGQSLRFGTFQVRKAGQLKHEGIFFDPDGVTEAELALSRSYAARHGLAFMTREQFVDDIIFGIGWKAGAAIIGFNLPFDISRVAIHHNSARGDMRGGFTFGMSVQKIFPHIQIKHLSRRAAFIRFAKPMGQPESSGMRRRKSKSAERRGHFIDIKTLASALFERSFDLAGLSKFLKVQHPKIDFDGFDAPITDEMLTYAVRDVQATWECYAELLIRFERLGFVSLVPEKVYSAASIGKGYLRDMGISPWRKLQPDFPRQLLGNIMGSYFGGRSEIGIRRELRQVILCDFLSMYPTVCTLMGLWDFVIADGMTWHDATEDARTFLGNVSLVTLRLPESWRRLPILVRVKSAGDIFPVRAAFMQEAQTTIGLNHLTAGKPLWFTMADCIAAKLLTGKAPEIIEAMSFAAGPPQAGLRPVNISGNPAYRVNPKRQDLFKRVIELRKSVQARAKLAEGEEREALDTEQHALKIAANSTAYGVYVEVNVVRRGNHSRVTVASSTDEPFGFVTDKVEEPGPYFHPLLASLITGAARLMLAITERQVIDHGLAWSFCDTDSMAIAKPIAMDGADFAAKVAKVVEWFADLNPYEFGGSILKVEDVNFALDTGEPEPLYCWAISAKRYALFNLAADGQPIMRKVSAHGLGHRLEPYRLDAPKQFPVPHESVLKDGIRRWHVDLWHAIVTSALTGRPDQVKLDYHPALQEPAISRYGATSPELLRWYKTHNTSKPYRDRVKPFGFLLSFSVKHFAPKESASFATAKRRNSKASPIKPVATFDKTLASAAARAFDRETGRPVPATALKTYVEDLAQYHLHPESKFLGGDYLDCGPTTRRHVRMIATRHIGKESNDWEAQAILGLNLDAAPDYRLSDEDIAKVQALFAAHTGAFGIAQGARDLGVSRQTAIGLARGAKDKSVIPSNSRYVAKLHSAMAEHAADEREKALNIENLKISVQRDGLRKTARELGIDPSNLRRRLSRKRRSIGTGESPSA